MTNSTLVAHHSSATHHATAPNEGAAAAVDSIEILSAWEHRAARSLAPSSRRQYAYWFLRFLSETLVRPTEASPEIVRAWLEPMHPQAANQARAALLHVFRFAEAEGLIAEAPIEEPCRVIPLRREPIAFTEDELRRLLVAAAWGWDDGRAWAFLAQFLTGCRSGELVALDAEDVRLDDPHPHLIFRHTKGRKERRVPLSAPAVEAFSHLRRRGRVVGVARSAYWARFKRAGVLAELPEEKLHPHTLRRTAITLMLQRGAKPETVAKLVGHEEVGTTMRFYRFVEQSEIRDAANLLSL